MARIVPTGWREVSALGAAQREIETLALFAAGLPDDYIVFHGVHWTRLDSGHSIFGEIDFAVLAPSGRVLLIEQKSGFLQETAEGLVKVYAQKEKKIAVQIARTADAIRARFKAAWDGAALPLDILLYCPDYTVKHPAAAGIDPSRIVDATRRDALLALIRTILPLEEPASALAETARQFFGDLLQLVPEVGSIAREAEALYTRLAGGLATWGRRIEFSPFRLRVIGTAGSGKTQLALAVFRDAVAAGRRPLYLCFNRPLADHMGTIVPPGGEVATYHQFCDRVVREQGVRIDFSAPGAFDRLESAFAQAVPGNARRHDDLIIDEGQDFRQEWLEPLMRLLAPGGRAWWLEDPLQNLYARPPVSLPGWVVLRADTNYRSPRDILEQVTRILGAEHPIEAGSPLSGSEVEILTYSGSHALIEATKRAITRAIGLGFKRPMIALVSFRGRGHSMLTPYTRLGPHSLRTFTGHYDLFGNPVHSEGEIVMETLYRFKGQSAPCVILTEVDFETLDELTMRKLFVGLTRATMKLILVVSEPTARILKPMLGTGAP